MKPNLDKIIQDNLDKAKFQSKLQPSLSKNTGWLDGYADGGLLSKKVTCSNCGWLWKAVDGGINPMTCHKCGGTIKMKQGGETYISGKALATQFGQYDEGGKNNTGYVPPIMPDLRHPGGSDIQNRGFQKPIKPLVNKKQTQELEKKNKRNAEQIEKAQYLSPYNQPLGRDYETNRVQKIKDWGAENGYTVTDDGKLITDDAIHKFMESKVANQLWDNIVAPIGEGIGYTTGAGETYQGLKTLANLGRLGVIKGLGKDALVNLFENKLTKSSISKGLNKKLNQLGDLADYVNLDPIGMMSQTGLPHLPSSDIKVGWKWDVNTSKYIPDISYDKLGVTANLADKSYNVLPNKAQLSGTSSFRQLYNHEPNLLPKNIKPYVVNNDINNLQFFDHNTGRYIGSSQVTGMGPTYEESVEALKPKLLENKTSKEFKQFIPPDYTDKGNSFLNGKPLPDIKLFNDGKPYIPEEKYGGDISIPNLNNNWLSKYENGSVVDYLADKNQDFSYSHRKEIAKELGIENYEGTADQNLQMLDKLKQSENVVTGKRYVKPPAQGIYFEDGVDVRTPNVPQREIPKVREKQKVVNKIPEYDPFGFIKQAVKNNNTSNKSPLPQPAPVSPVNKVNDSSWYNRFGDWFGGMENTLNKIKENTLGRPGFIPDNNNNKPKNTPPISSVPPNAPKPKVVEGTKKDSRYLESGMIEDKNKGEMYVIKNGKVVKTMPILTGLNKNGEVNDKDFYYLKSHPEEGKKLKATPTGTYLSVPNSDLYGYPGFNMNPIPAFGQPAPKAKALAQHVIYGAGPKGSHGYDPAEGARRTKIMQGLGENRVGSFGCTNMYGQDINCLTGQLFPKGDTTIVVDSRRPADQSFLKNTYGVKKMGGEPCYNCGGMYNKGGQTNWLDKYK